MDASRIHDMTGDQAAAYTHEQGGQMNVAHQHPAQDLMGRGFGCGFPTQDSPVLTDPVLALSPAIRRVLGLNRIAAFDCC
jgi:hypothetical protein